MTSKNWGDHPVVVLIGVLASLSGLIGFGINLSSAPESPRKTKSSEQVAQQDNNVNITSIKNSNVTINMNNYRRIESHPNTQRRE